VRIFLAFRVFFAVLFSKPVAGSVAGLLEGPTDTAPAQEQPKPKPAPKPKQPARNDAVTLLAALQREARFVDFIKEPIEGYADAQIGAAVRDVHRDCAAVLERMFDLKPVLDAAEQSDVDVPEGFDSGMYRLTGNVTGEAPFAGRLMHHGWKAAKCDVPKWTGSDTAARVIAPAEVELS